MSVIPIASATSLMRRSRYTPTGRRSQGREHQESDAARKITAIDRDHQLSADRGARAQVRGGIGGTRLSQEAAPSEHSGCKWHEIRHEAVEHGHGSCDQ